MCRRFRRRGGIWTGWSENRLHRRGRWNDKEGQEGLRAAGCMTNIAYVIPEWPGQTHIWMWREIVNLRAWGVEITIFSTRRPAEKIRARHAFAKEAEAETIYLTPLSAPKVAGAMAWALARHPIGLARAIWLGMTLPVNKRPAIKTVLPLIIPAALLARDCARRGIGRLHSNTASNSAILCMMVKRILGIPWSMTLNANIEWWGGAMGEKFADADFTNTHAAWLLGQIRAQYPNLRPEQSLLARTGVDTSYWKPDPTAPMSLSGARHRLNLMTVGRLHASKGHDVLLRAVKILADQGVDVGLRIAGGGDEEQALKALASELRIENRVTLLGSLPEDRVMQELRSADLFVMGSLAEPLGVVAMEAMALGIAPIGTAAGGLGEIIDDGENGLLVPPGDPAALAAAVATLAGDEPRRRSLAAAARRKIVETFDSRDGAAQLYMRFFGESPAGYSPTHPAAAIESATKIHAA